MFILTQFLFWKKILYHLILDPTRESYDKKELGFSTAGAIPMVVNKQN